MLQEDRFAVSPPQSTAPAAAVSQEGCFLSFPFPGSFPFLELPVLTSMRAFFLMARNLGGAVPHPRALLGTLLLLPHVAYGACGSGTLPCTLTGGTSTCLEPVNALSCPSNPANLPTCDTVWQWEDFARVTSSAEHPSSSIIAAVTTSTWCSTSLVLLRRRLLRRQPRRPPRQPPRQPLRPSSTEVALPASSWARWSSSGPRPGRLVWRWATSRTRARSKQRWLPPLLAVLPRRSVGAKKAKKVVPPWAAGLRKLGTETTATGFLMPAIKCIATSPR